MTWTAKTDFNSVAMGDAGLVDWTDPEKALRWASDGAEISLTAGQWSETLTFSDVATDLLPDRAVVTNIQVWASQWASGSDDLYIDSVIFNSGTERAFFWPMSYSSSENYDNTLVWGTPSYFGITEEEAHNFATGTSGSLAIAVTNRWESNPTVGSIEYLQIQFEYSITPVTALPVLT